jgi:amidase
MVWNVLDYPACSFPVIRVNPKVDVKSPAHEFFNPEDKAHYDSCKFGMTLVNLVTDVCWCMKDDPNVYDGVPVGLQLVGQKHEDEAVIAMTAIVSKAVQDYFSSSK